MASNQTSSKDFRFPNSTKFRQILDVEKEVDQIFQHPRSPAWVWKTETAISVSKLCSQVASLYLLYWRNFILFGGSEIRVSSQDHFCIFVAWVLFLQFCNHFLLGCRYTSESNQLKISVSYYIYMICIIIDHSIEFFAQALVFKQWLADERTRDKLNDRDVSYLMFEMQSIPIGLTAGGIFSINYNFVASVSRLMRCTRSKIRWLTENWNIYLFMLRFAHLY